MANTSGASNMQSSFLKQNSIKKEEAATCVEQISSEDFARKGSKKTGLLGELFSCFGKNSSRVQALRLLEPSHDIQMNSHEEGDFNYKTGFVGSPQVDDCNPPMRSPKSHNVPYRPSKPSAPS